MYFDVTTHARADSVSSPFGMMRMGDGVTLMTDITYNAVVESSFQLLKRERIKRQIYLRVRCRAWRRGATHARTGPRGRMLAAACGPGRLQLPRRTGQC